LRFDGASWRRLPTTLLGSSGGFATYVATSSGLSVFAVAVPAPTVSQPSGQSNASSNLSALANGSGTPGAGGLGVNESAASPPTTESASFFTSRTSFWLVIVFVLLLGGGLVDYFYYRRRRHQAHAALTAAYSRAEVGHPAAIVDDREVTLEKLRAFIAGELARGHTKAQIRAVLLKAGWQATVVDEELAHR
jgi:hypothetical protein